MWQRYSPRAISRAAPDGGLILTKSGDVNLSPALYARLGSPTHLVFFFDPETRKVGFRPAREEDADGLRVSRRRPAGPSVGIAGMLRLHKAPARLSRFTVTTEGVLTVFGPLLRVSPAEDPPVSVVRQMVAQAQRGSG